MNIYEQNLDKNEANFQPLTPITFLHRAADVFPEHPAVIHGTQSRSWAQTRERAERLAAALRDYGIGRGDTVAVMCANLPEFFEAHFGVPMSGAVLNAINTRLDAKVIAFILEHARARVLLSDTGFAGTVREALSLLREPPLVVDILDPLFEGGERLGELDYDEFLDRGRGVELEPQPLDEWQAIALNYTSGTTGNPKGVVYHHRGAYLGAISNPLIWGMTMHPVYLWTLPMFHCNGWCFPWAVAAMVGTNVCLRQVRAEPIFDLMRSHGVTHFCGAPVVMSTLINAPEELKSGIEHRVHAMTAGAAPPAAVIQAMEEMGFSVTHVYGLTETYGPAVVCEEQPAWRSLSARERSDMKARQGVRYPMLEGLMVADPDTLQPVPRDGQTMGEVFMQGNLVMKGYLKNAKATGEAFAGGWFHSGDLAVWHQDGYIQIKDRSKDIIISGGENISSLEIEDVLFRHPAVIDAAVVAIPHEKWGETPCAFVTLRDGNALSEDEIIAHCREHLAHFKCPTRVIFGPIAKTSTGKVQKYKLRESVVP